MCFTLFYFSFVVSLSLSFFFFFFFLFFFFFFFFFFGWARWGRVRRRKHAEDMGRARPRNHRPCFRTAIASFVLFFFFFPFFFFFFFFLFWIWYLRTCMFGWGITGGRRYIHTRNFAHGKRRTMGQLVINKCMTRTDTKYHLAQRFCEWPGYVGAHGDCSALEH